jgi:hypothetical protein
MRISPLRMAKPGSRTGFGRGALAGGLLLAVAAAAAATGAGPATAAPLSGTASVQQANEATEAAGAGTPQSARVTWAVQPATATGQDRSRTLFTYGVVKPGSTVVDHVEIVNYSTVPAAFSIYGTDATGTAASGALLLLSPQKKPTDIGAWVHFPGGAQQLSTIIGAGKAIIEQFTIKVPPQATPGDHTGGLAAAVTFTHENSAGVVVTENYRIAVPLELRVPGALRTALQVQSISTGFSDPLNPFGTGAATVSYTVANTGNVRLTGTQTVTVTGPFGQKVSLKPPKLPTILPGDSIRVTTQAHGLFPAGPMTASIAVTPGWPQNTLPVSTNLLAATVSASLFAMPWSLLGLILLLVAIGVGIWFYLRYRRRLRRAELAAVAARASRDTERRLLGGSRAPNGHAAKGDGAKPPAAPVTAAPAEVTAPGGGPDGGTTAAEGATE